MKFKFEHLDQLSFGFTIQHVSRLLVFRDHWNESLVMRRVISEILKSGAYSELYIGNRPEKYPEQYYRDYKDCAIIHIRISGIQNLEYHPESVEALFGNEVKNEKNMLHFDNTRLSVENNVSCIDVTIRILESYTKRDEEMGAA